MTSISDIGTVQNSFAVWFLRTHRWLIGILAAHVVATVVVGLYAGVPYEPTVMNRLATIFTFLFPLFILILIVWKFFTLMHDTRPGSPITKMVGDIRTGLLNPEQSIGGVLAFLLIAVCTATFGHWKAIITEIQPFAWDVAFAEMDRWMHFGQDPYVLLLPLTGYPIVTSALNLAYHLWLLVVYFVIFAACFMDRNQETRMSFLIAFVLTFIIGGNVLATVFSSAGPVYFERLGYGDTYVPLMTMLASFNEVYPVKALAVQEILWHGYYADGHISGISAMPSMHNASSFLIAFYAYTWRRWAGHLLMAFALIILVGSIHLGWHYAVDAYAGFLVAAGCWSGARWLVRKTSCAISPFPPVRARWRCRRPE